VVSTPLKKYYSLLLLIEEPRGGRTTSRPSFVHDRSLRPEEGPHRFGCRPDALTGWKWHGRCGPPCRHPTSVCSIQPTWPWQKSHHTSHLLWDHNKSECGAFLFTGRPCSSRLRPRTTPWQSHYKRAEQLLFSAQTTACSTAVSSGRVWHSLTTCPPMSNLLSNVPMHPEQLPRLHIGVGLSWKGACTIQKQLKLFRWAADWARGFYWWHPTKSIIP